MRSNDELKGLGPWWLRLGVILAAMVGCSDGETAGSVADAVSIQQVGADSTQPDVTAAADGAEPDGGEADSTEPDVGPLSTCEPGEGCFGESCSGNDDCLSGICAMHMGEMVCSKTCDETCPEGWECQLVGGGSDGQYVCVSNFSHLCLPCETADGCSGNTPNACISYGETGSFCGGACDETTPCPEGYACQEAEASTGAVTFQCVATTGVCGCTELAVESGLGTTCRVTNELGTCEGMRICEQEGLSACDAASPNVESCNGLDDDCNGSVDDVSCDDGNPCTDDLCQGEDGCLHTPLLEGECLDGSACTQGDHCEDGECVGEVLSCDDGEVCTVDSCDPETGCIHTPIFEVCTDGDACTLGDTCKDGVCSPGPSLDCDDGNPCTDDTCGEGGCLHAANTAPCDDQNACSIGDSCKEGVCVAVELLDCDDKNLCTTDTCTLEGGCQNVPNLQPCDDGDLCTLGDTCSNGACEGGSVPTCDDKNPCTVDSCNDGGCTFEAMEGPCDDGNACTEASLCQDGACIGVQGIVCDDNNPCTSDGCDPLAGCVNTPTDLPCSDGSVCTLGDSCSEGQCQPGVLSLACEDGNPCTHDACNAQTGCVFTAHTEPCDDGNACTLGDACENGACQIGPDPLACDDANPCTEESCDPNQGCVSTNHTEPCDDNNLCTVGDACSGGVCAAGPDPLDCNDADPCTLDTCDPQGGCTNQVQADETPCSEDGLSWCIAGACVTKQICGNGLVEGDEECDDGNDNENDGCNTSCESGYGECPATPAWKEVWHHPLSSTPPGASVQHGAWNSQGPANVAGKACWRQMSDWNILWVPHPSPNVDRFAVEVESHRPVSPSEISGYFGGITQKTGYNGTASVIGFNSQKGNTNLVLSSYPQGPDETIELAGKAIRGEWHTWRVEVDKPSATALYFQNGEFLGCQKVDPAAFSGTQIKVGSNGIAYQVAANASWANLRVFVAE